MTELEEALQAIEEASRDSSGYCRGCGASIRSDHLKSCWLVPLILLAREQGRAEAVEAAHRYSLDYQQAAYYLNEAEREILALGDALAHLASSIDSYIDAGASEIDGWTDEANKALASAHTYQRLWKERNSGSA